MLIRPSRPDSDERMTRRYICIIGSKTDKLIVIIKNAEMVE